MQPDDEVYTEWLAAAPKGIRWDKAQEMFALYQERRREQAAAVAKRLLGKPKYKQCPSCHGWGRFGCAECGGTGDVLK